MTGKTRSLFSLLMGHTLGAFAVFFVVFTVAFAAGFALSRDRWQKAAVDTIGAALRHEAARLVGPDGRLDGDAVNRVMMRALDPTVSAVVFGVDGTPVFWAWGGRSWFHEDSPDERAAAAAEGDPLADLSPEARARLPQNQYRSLAAEGRLSPLRNGSQDVGSFFVERRSFDTMEENAELMASLVWALAWSLGAASLAAALFAWGAFRRSARRAGQLEAGLTAIAEGRRDVTFAPAGARELEGVAAAALRLQTALAREQELRRRWTQDIAHDLKTPLSGLKVQLQALNDGVLQPGGDRIQILLNEVGQLETLTSDLLVLSRLESPELKVSRTVLSLSDLVSPLRHLFEPLIRASGREWVWKQGEGTLAVDQELMHRALLNLVANAVTHASGAGAIEAHWQVRAGMFLAVIINPGHLEDEAGSLFQRLRRGEPSRTGSGNGLGLTIALAVIERHGGTLTLSNASEGRIETRLAVPTSLL